MKPLFLIFFIMLYSAVFSQKIIPIDSTKINSIEMIFVDDYQNIYLYEKQNFSLTKYDTLGQPNGRIMLPFPFKIQSVQNPLNIPLFSENKQEIKLLDHHLNEIQKISLGQLGFVKMAYIEDLQQVWLLDDSSKRLLQYNYREGRGINSYPLDFNFDEIEDFLVYQRNIYILTQNNLSIYNFQSEKLFSTLLEEPRKLRRENGAIYIITQREIFSLKGNHTLESIFHSEKANFVEKNSSAFFEIFGNKLYIYPLEKINVK